MLVHSIFDAEQIKKEREVVCGEMRLYKDNPDRYLSQMVFNNVYKQHPYGIPVIGYEDLLRSLTRDDFLDYYKSRYVPNNIVLAIAGPVRSRDILPKVNDGFKDFIRKPVLIRNLAPEPQQINNRLIIDKYHTDLARVSMAYSGVGLRDQDLYAMDVLAMLLGQGESSRLFRSVYLDKKLVRSISSSNLTPLDRGFFEIEMLLEEQNIEVAVQAVKDQLTLVAVKGVTSQELEKVKRQVVCEHIYGRLTSDGVANSNVMDEAFLGDTDFSRKYVDAIRGLGPGDIKRVAQKYFVENGLSLTILKTDRTDQTSNDVGPVAQAAPIQKVVLPNGLTLLLRENHSSPVISIHLVMSGGTWQETASTNGLSELTSRLLLSGTKLRTAADIAREVESRGASLRPFSGRGSFGMSFNGLADDTRFGLDLIVDMIKNPVFPEQEILRQKQDMATAIINEADNINSVASQAIRETLFETHPFRFNVLGTLKSLKTIQRSDIVTFFDRYVVPNNMVISISGDFDGRVMAETVKRAFAEIPRKECSQSLYTENPPEKTREKTIKLNKKQAMVMIGFQGVDIKSSDRDAMTLLSSLLGSSFSGRIFNTIRDKFGHAYTLGGGFTPGRDKGLMIYYVQTTDENVGKVVDLLKSIFLDIRTKPVADIELRDMKTYLKGTFQMENQLDSSLSFNAALDELYGNGYDYYQSYEKRIDSVTAEDIRRLAAVYLDMNKAAIVIIRPTDQARTASESGLPRESSDGPTDIH